jgi:hypothetical protein
VVYAALLAVDRSAPHHPSTEEIRQALVTEAHAEEGKLGATPQDERATNAEVRRLFGGARTRRQDDVARAPGVDLALVDSIIPFYPDFRPERAEELGEVPGERVVVVDEEDAVFHLGLR